MFKFNSIFLDASKINENSKHIKYSSSTVILPSLKTYQAKLYFNKLS